MDWMTQSANHGYRLEYVTQKEGDSMNIREVEGGITAAKGFLAYGLRAGIKAGKTNKDMAMIYSEQPATVAGTFTLNVVKAAPVLWDKKLVETQETAQAIVVNSGIANACTGDEGYENTKKMAEETAKLFGIAPEAVLVSSTGVIGKQLDMDIISKGIASFKGKLEGTKEAANLAAEAILTTDTHKKEIALQFEIGGRTITMGGMCKGSGMIHPNMGTMLGFITTDLSISKELLVKALKNDIKDTFNMVSVDGDTSTNDTVLILANGMAGNDMLTEENEEYAIFCEALNVVNTYLAKQIAGDGEGATRLLETVVLHAPDKDTAVTLAKSITTSSLTKAAVFGKDANWGRILCAMGYSGAQFDPDKVDITISSANGTVKLVENGMATDYDEAFATEVLSPEQVSILADVKLGDATATAWGCDLTYDYVKINADYRS